jgi:iron complex transport system substrate-binding protein
MAPHPARIADQRQYPARCRLRRLSHRASSIVILAAWFLVWSASAWADPPQRIISLVPSVTETLFAIGAGPRVVGVSSFDKYPPGVERLPRVGALIDPDLERILSLRPDLVVTYASQDDLSARLSLAGIRTFPFRHGGLDDVVRTIREVGKAVGFEKNAAQVASSIQAGLERIRERVAGRPRPRTVIVIGREPGALRAIDVSGGYGFLHDLLVVAGGDNLFGDVSRESLTVTTETLIARAPEVIIELHYDTAPAAEMVARERDTWKRLPSLPAVRGGRVVLLYGGELVIPGPRVVRTAEAFAQALHPASPVR